MDETSKEIDQFERRLELKTIQVRLNLDWIVFLCCFDGALSEKYHLRWEVEPALAWSGGFG